MTFKILTIDLRFKGTFTRQRPGHSSLIIKRSSDFYTKILQPSEFAFLPEDWETYKADLRVDRWSRGMCTEESFAPFPFLLFSLTVLNSTDEFLRELDVTSQDGRRFYRWA